MGRTVILGGFGFGTRPDGEPQLRPEEAVDPQDADEVYVGLGDFDSGDAHDAA